MTKLTAEPYEQQFWNTFEDTFPMSELHMKEVLPQMLNAPQSGRSIPQKHDRSQNLGQ